MCSIKRIFNICLVVFIFVNLISLNVFASAEDYFEDDATGSLVIDYTYNSDPLDDVSFKVYHIATLTSFDELQTNDKFLDMDIEYTDLSSEEYWLNLRDNLENYISLNQISADVEFITDDYGQYKLDDLSLGLYYIEAENLVDGNDVYFSEPIMIFVGQYDNEDDKWIYNFTLKPKISMLSYEPYPNITVTKVWENTSDEFIKTQSVEVGLYCNGNLYDTVILNDENDWQYTWYEMSCCDDWAVLEINTLEDYQVTYSKNIYDITITNTYIGEEPPEEPEIPDEPNEPEIPQTGSFANKISMCAGVGLILILLGFIIKLIGKPHEN